MSDSITRDIDVFVDNARFGKFHIRILLICTAMMMIDGYDLYVVGWVLPALSTDYGVSRTDLTSVLMIQQVGMLVGGYFIAPLADRIGRRKLLLFCVIAVALSSFVTILAGNVMEFTVCRVLTGIFAGAIVPNLLAMISEMAPKKFRATMATIVLGGAMGGALIGAFIQAFVLEQHGWQGAFWVGAILPVLMLPIIYFFMPESLRYFVQREPQNPQIKTIAAQIEPGLGENINFVENIDQTEASEKESFAGQIIGKRHIVRSVLLWLAFLCSFNFISFYASWATTIFKDLMHMSWSEVAQMTTMHMGFGIVGTLLAGILSDRFGFKIVVPILMIGGAISAIFIGISGAGFFMLIALAMMSMGHVGGQAGLAALSPTIYSPRVRATGVGWAYGAGRIGAMLAPLFGAIYLKAGFDAGTIFALMSIPLFLAGMFVFLITRKEVMSQRLVESRVE